MADLLAMAVRDAQNKHAESLRSGDDRSILIAYINALEAERALFLDGGGLADVEAAAQIGFQIEDERAVLAGLAA